MILFLFALTYNFSGQAFGVLPLLQGPSSTDSQFLGRMLKQNKEKKIKISEGKEKKQTHTNQW